MIFTIALLTFSTQLGGCAGSSYIGPFGRSGAKMSEIYLDPLDRSEHGSEFLNAVKRGDEGAKCDCQGLCGYGHGKKNRHVLLATNKESGLYGRHWGEDGYRFPWDPDKGNHKKIVYCYEHTCNPGHVSVCEEEHVSLNINHGSYARSHRACTCAKAAGQWVRVSGSFQDTSITRSKWREHTYEVTKTHSSSIEDSIGASLAIEGIGFSSTTTLTRTLEVAISQSWANGHNIDITITCNSGGEKDNAWLYGIYLYDVLCTQNYGRDSRFISQEEYPSNGCALSVHMAIEEGYVCTAGKEEPPCCGPGANPTDTVNRKYCEDDFKSWTGQCDGYEHRTRVTSLQDSQHLCINYGDQCSDLLSPDLGGFLANCGAHCGNNAYANVFDPTFVFGQTNMLECNSRPGWTNTIFNNFCQRQTENEHSVFMLSRDCGWAVWARRGSFDNAYTAAEHNVGFQDAREFIPIYYNNWYGACDGRRALAAEDVFEFEHCKCDTECPFWGDCCDHCKEAMEKTHDGEFMSELEMEALRSSRATMTEEEYVNAKDGKMVEEILDYHMDIISNFLG